MNLSMKQKQTGRNRENRLVVVKNKGLGEEWSGRLGLASEAFIHRVKKEQGPTVQHRELYSIFYDKP